MPKPKDLVIAPLGEGGLILFAAAVGFFAHAPLVFASLGPTAYEMLERPTSKIAKPYNVVVGHFVALGAGFLSLWLLNAWYAPKVASAEIVPAQRLWAAAISVAITTLLMLLLKAGQPAALSTALIVSLGSMQTTKGAVAIVVGVLLVTLVGEPIRRQRAKESPPPGTQPGD